MNLRQTVQIVGLIVAAFTIGGIGYKLGYDVGNRNRMPREVLDHVDSFDLPPNSIVPVAGMFQVENRMSDYKRELPNPNILSGTFTIECFHGVVPLNEIRYREIGHFQVKKGDRFNFRCDSTDFEIHVLDLRKADTLNNVYAKMRVYQKRLQ